ncbi:hypothetical protein [Roseibacillus ishigakijimensis]|uniref:MetA-pathway of phenol degradation n=1 Tax=Roseibacillus ishigakijimensis TaxID=454146 RepID=A0A934RQH2_9BACT|nr:hypothetical protein [Roseibacillus ishigakijimensis]MBK1833726.1 hypothetical protein [Roseibacillus ishigakijimensis]
MKKSTLALSLVAGLAPATQAQLIPAPFAIGGEHQFAADIDDSGEFSRSAARFRVSAPLHFTDDYFVGLTAGGVWEHFEFDDTLVNPWEDVYRPQVAVVSKGTLANGWTWLAIPWVAADAEDGADWGEALTYGGMGAAWTEVSDSLTLGAGLGVRSQLEDDVQVFPILVIDWKICPDLTFSTLPPEGFRVGPAASLRWDARDDLALSLVYSYQSDRHRLAENSDAAPDGIGQFRQHRIALAATHQFHENLSLTGHLGYTFGGELEVEDSDGDQLDSRDFDGSLVLGLEGSWRF